MSDPDPFRAALQLAAADIRRKTIIECANVVNETARQAKGSDGIYHTLVETEKRIMNLIYTRSAE